MCVKPTVLSAGGAPLSLLVAHRTNPKVADMRVPGQVPTVLAPEVLDQLSRTWGVPGLVAEQMFARLADPDYQLGRPRLPGLIFVPERCR